MYQHIRAIALYSVKYSDRSNILTAWSREMGRIAILMPDTSSRESRRRRALTMPLSIFEGELDVRPNREIHTIRDIRPGIVAPSISAHFSKTAIAMFIAECLNNMLRESAVADNSLWTLIETTVAALENLENNTAIANLHLWFLYRLCIISGICPDLSTFANGSFFDLRSGQFLATPPLHTDYVGQEATEFIYALSRTTPRSLHLLRLTTANRNTALDIALRYCSLHGLNPGTLHSLDILRSIFS